MQKQYINDNENDILMRAIRNQYINNVKKQYNKIIMIRNENEILKYTGNGVMKKRQ
jgi:hypothetical protein